jgi:hypothetical protein
VFAANIHYPVDWVLLRDATQTLMKAVSLIRAKACAIAWPSHR